ncbi:3-deoxy-7-phosphoheptulonate synthase [Lachnospiraceae bacterium YH-ros2228]
MEMQMDFKRRLPIPKEIKEMFPLRPDVRDLKERRDQEIQRIFRGEDPRLILIIGPCSADREDAVLDYMTRLAKLQEKVKDKIYMIPRVYTNKPRTTGMGYKGMTTQPDPTKGADVLGGLIAIRQLHTKVVEETGFTCADEMLYPANHRYLSDLLAYVAVGARSVENQEHRLTASGVGIPVGMKNPTGGDLSVMMNSLIAAQNGHTFIYRNWEVQTSGNPYTHCILRGYVDKFGRSHPNYHYEDLLSLSDAYANHPDLKFPSVIVDCNHNNSGKKFLEQIRIAKEVMQSRSLSNDIRKIFKGFMIESYLEDGNQPVGGGVYGQSITDACLGWEKTERLVLDLADLA